MTPGSDAPRSSRGSRPDSRPGPARIAGWTTGVLLQLSAVTVPWWTEWDEVNLFLGILIFALGSVFSMLATEVHVVALGRSAAWALTALVGPVAPLVALRLEARDVSPDPIQTRAS